MEMFNGTGSPGFDPEVQEEAEIVPNREEN